MGVVPMRSVAGWLGLALTTCAMIAAPEAAKSQPATAVTLQATRQADGVVRVIVDFARMLLLAQPASTLIIGNPAIAQATLSDDKTVVLTGRTPGSTNLIVIGADGAQVANVILDVVAAGGRLVTVDGGEGKTTYSCAGRCAPIRSDGVTAPQPEITAPEPEPGD
ncbi:pilus assembly protein N-terminal domain-containing protein (plasmid) [Sinorhizobium meliloti]|uniref:pilus assembly protein N-terminal domain-containing protein n=1 Tax=Rhizobium meliloti TaxID=382 RepID=UPI002D79D25B|nr:pilus assembly protein N-terminal domain-containing protein [Sinorhizobium meliloti]WRQ71147.1 pilus assembly protein N-terminal domain-containing protein [Sinorhizobium meliloti]